MNNPIVSIGIPTYNRPRTLQRTLNSLVNQTYKNLEIIVSDNCSTDKDVENVMLEFAGDKRVKFYKQDVNRGAVYNFNFVLDKFTGNYFMRIGDDDWVEPNYVESCLNFLRGNPEYVCAYGRTRIFNLDGKFIQYDAVISLEQDNYQDRMVFYYGNVLQNGLYFGLIRKEYVECIRNEKKLADDWFGGARLSFSGKVKMISETYLNLSQNGTGMSVESIVKGFGLSKFNRYFPYLTISINAYLDILFLNSVYRKLRLKERKSLATICSGVIYKRFNVKKEIKGSYKYYLKSIVSSKSS